MDFLRRRRTLLNAISITEARKQFLSMVEEVSQGLKKVMLTKRGRPAAVVVSATEYFQMRETLDLLLQSNEVKKIAKGLADLEA